MFSINVYDNAGNVVRECKMKPAQLKFGVVRRLFKLLKITDEVDTAGLFAVVYENWADLLEILGDNFPDVTDEEWDNIPIDEVARAIIEILKYSLYKLSGLTNKQKN